MEKANQGVADDRQSVAGEAPLAMPQEAGSGSRDRGKGKGQRGEGEVRAAQWQDLVKEKVVRQDKRGRKVWCISTLGAGLPALPSSSPSSSPPPLASAAAAPAPQPCPPPQEPLVCQATSSAQEHGGMVTNVSSPSGAAEALAARALGKPGQQGWAAKQQWGPRGVPGKHLAGEQLPACASGAAFLGEGCRGVLPLECAAREAQRPGPPPVLQRR